MARHSKPRGTRQAQARSNVLQFPTRLSSSSAPAAQAPTPPAKPALRNGLEAQYNEVLQVDSLLTCLRLAIEALPELTQTRSATLTDVLDIAHGQLLSLANSLDVLRDACAS